MESQASRQGAATRSPRLARERAEQANRPLLCLVTDRKICRLPFLQIVEQAIAAGIDWLQVRERDLDAHALYALTETLQALVHQDAAQSGKAPAKARTQILINRRLDVALALHADGVHLGSNALALMEAQSLLPHDALVGCAAHSLADVQKAATDGADYVHLAPIFPPRSKPAQSPPLGLAALEEASRVGIPVIAQGGITPQNARAAIEAGASGIAVTGEILLCETPYEVCRALREAIDAAKPHVAEPHPSQSATTPHKAHTEG